jgi:hypothetical protein
MSTLKTTNIQHPDSINPQIALTSASVTVNSILKLNSTVDFTSASITGLDLLPSQTGQSGKYLTTNGTVASWGVVDLSAYAPLSGATFTGVVTGVSPTAAGSIGFRRVTMSTAGPSGGADGDLWVQYS